MKRFIAVLSCIAMSLALSGIAGCNSGVDSFTRDKAREAVAVGESYLNGSTTAMSASDKLDTIHDELQAYTKDDSTAYVLVCSGITVLDSSIILDYSDSEIREYVNDLKKYC